MYWTNFLHFYQPANQHEDILNRVVNECYRPLLKGLVARPNAKCVININGALTELLDKYDYSDVISDIKTLLDRGQIEVTSSAMYHAFLPLLPADEITRQIKLNDDLNTKYYGASYKPAGFFSPEMAVSPAILDTVSKLGYKWIACPEISYGQYIPVPDRLYVDEQTGITTFFRNKQVSMVILTAQTHNVDDFLFMIKTSYKKDNYLFSVMDAETFGHHRVGYEDFLFELMESDYFETCTCSELMVKKYAHQKVHIRPCTWTNDEQDFWLDNEKTVSTETKSFTLWKHPDNPIHQKQWELLNFVIEVVNKYEDKESKKWKQVRGELDKNLASDPFWWASAKPWWSLEIIEQGAFALKALLLDLFGPDSSEYKKGLDIYREILEQAFDWQRTGYIRKQHVQNSSTYMKEPFKKRAPLDWSNLMILELEDEMNKCASKQDLELAIKWRDAIIKISKGTDIYDILHVIDELWAARSLPQLKSFFENDWDDLSSFAKKHLIGINSREDFERLKMNYKDGILS